jgi:hypothetical protein
MKVNRTVGGLLLGRKKGRTIDIPAYRVPQSSNSPLKGNPERKPASETAEGILRKTKNGGKMTTAKTGKQLKKNRK